MMKKRWPGLLLVSIVLTFTLSGQTPPPQQKPEDIQKNLVLVEKIQSVPDKWKTGFDSITAQDSIAMLSYIASDLLEGRETTTRGFQLAAEYAASLFSLWRLKPGGDQPGAGLPMRGAFLAREQVRRAPAGRSFLQELAMKETTESSIDISLDLRMGPLGKSRTFQSGVDFQSAFPAVGSIQAPVVFAGYGITEKKVGYDDFKNLDVKGKIVLIISEAPGKDNPESPFQKDKELKEKYFPPVQFMMFPRGADRFNKTQEIAKLGVAAILQVQNSIKDSEMFKGLAGPRRVSDERPIITEPRRRLALPGAGGQRMPWEGSPVINITRETADAILEGSGKKIEELQKQIDTAWKPASLELPGTRLTVNATVKTSLVRCRNVVGYVEGSDATLKGEAVVVGAHLDHLGKRGDYIFNGADDNGSGSVGVINLARAFVSNPEKPKRTVIFCLWTGEEEGLLGSRYYVQNPAFPIKKTVAYFNMDMISRPYDEQTLSRMARMMNIPVESEVFKKLKPANFLPVSFSSGAGLDEILKKADQYIGLDLYLRESKEGERGMGGSDHSSFGAVKIPWLFVITSMHEDYHQTSDSVDKVSGESIERISRLAYLTTWALADK
jgi:hypothetical protein